MSNAIMCFTRFCATDMNTKFHQHSMSYVVPLPIPVGYFISLVSVIGYLHSAAKPFPGFSLNHVVGRYVALCRSST